jgi:hypothetical protein
VNDTVYFAAGYSSYVDGGIRVYGLEVETGRVKCDTTLVTEGSSRNGILPDILLSDGQTIMMRQKSFDLSLNPSKKPKLSMIVANTGLLEDSWGHRWNWQLGPGDTFGKLLAFNAQMAYGLQTYYTFLKHDKSMYPDTHDGHMHQKYARYTPEQFPIGTRVFARENNKQKIPEGRRSKTLKANVYEWSEKMLFQFRALVLVGDTLFAAGWKDSVGVFETNPKTENTSLLMAISTTDGRAIKKYPLKAKPTYDGLAAAYNKLYISLKDGTILCLGEK